MTSPSAVLRSRDFRKILLIKLSAVGDVIRTDFRCSTSCGGAYPAGTTGLAGDAGHRRVAAAQSGHHQCGSSSPAKDWSETVDAGAVCQLRAARRQAARQRATIWWSIMHGPIPHPRRSRSRLARRYGSVSNGRARGCGTPHREHFGPGAQACLAGRARGQLARLQHSITSRCRRSICTRSIAISSVGPILGLEEGLAGFFLSHSASRKLPNRVAAAPAMTSPARHWSPWRRGDLGNQALGNRQVPPKWRGTSCKRVSPWR